MQAQPSLCAECGHLHYFGEDHGYEPCPICECPGQWIVFSAEMERGGPRSRHEAWVSKTSIPRSKVGGHLVIEHSSCSYVICESEPGDAYAAGDYVAFPIQEGI
jgi:hypothetical protein